MLSPYKHTTFEAVLNDAKNLAEEHNTWVNIYKCVDGAFVARLVEQRARKYLATVNPEGSLEQFDSEQFLD